ncbi:MAG: hypothetical protein ACRER2_01220 [Methylococcales bacterium]
MRDYLDDWRDAQTAEKTLDEIEQGEQAVLKWEDVKKGLYDNRVLRKRIGPQHR